MKKVTSIDGIAFDYPLYISSEFDISDYIGERSVAIDGSSVMFVQAKGAFTKEVSLTSKDTGWVTKDTKDLLINTIDELSKTVIFDDTTTGTYYYDHTKTPISFSPLYEGSLWYTIEINLVKG